MTEAELEAIEARASAATEGTWFNGRDPSNEEIVYDGDPHTDGIAIGEMRHDEDVNFIAHARTDVPALIAEVRRLRERPDVPPCECEHSWDVHGVAGRRGGCAECECDLVVGIIETGTVCSTFFKS